MTMFRTFSRVFPSYHPKAGESTFFVEKIWNSLDIQVSYKMICDLNKELPAGMLWEFWRSINQEIAEVKHHTIRAEHHFKPGDTFSPRVWSGKPYRSKQIIIAPDIEVKKVWDFEINEKYKTYFGLNGNIVEYDTLKIIATNDGLHVDDFENWFNVKKGEWFSGQVICWSDKIEY